MLQKAPCADYRQLGRAFETQVKDHTAALEMLREIAFPEELILNANTNRLIEYLRAHTNILENRKDADAILRSFENV